VRSSSVAHEPPCKLPPSTTRVAAK
jgi:hypothetical protein